MLSQAMTNQVGKQRGARQEEADTSRFREFLRRDPPSFTGSTTIEDLENFVEELKKIFEKCMGDTSLIIPTEDIGIKDSLSYEEIPVPILDRQVHKLRTKEVASVKVLWRNHFVEEATWEAEEDMKNRYPLSHPISNWPKQFTT
ncbi:hypothetical protein MTR67_027338 [Solanum verrucosum]|uniref:Chromo domain-containing protein n=1 Tax=Solanum verrucosum TaxID=315347 RepID=A0AAF0U039_SOLVR|nr:hypothetical protein MTR67_027338 [Solanum verrucosum]